MQVVPGAGDIKAGRADWRFSAEGENTTRMVFDAEIEPDFWVPPLIGPYLIARAWVRTPGEFRGVVRRFDVLRNNTVESELVADAFVSYTGTGPITNSNRRRGLSSWLYSAVDWIWPF